MKSKKAGIISWGIFLLILLLIYFIALPILKDEITKYRSYKDFCEMRPTYCYCSYGEYTFKSTLTQKCVNYECSEFELDNNTKELCKLAMKLNDKKVLFNMRCAE